MFQTKKEGHQRFAEYPGLIGDVANGIFMIVFLTTAQLSFIKYTLLESEDADHPLKQAISVIEKALCVYILFVPISLLEWLLSGDRFPVAAAVVAIALPFIRRNHLNTIRKEETVSM
ncbi:hypothetical protein MHI57_18470 [Cytobacillus sp. FSL K6-0129]